MRSENSSGGKTARLFRNGASQAVRLPAEYRFEGEEVHIWRDERTGTVVLSPRRRVTRAEFMQMRDTLPDEELAQFMNERHQPPAQMRTALTDDEGS
jgi:antitoxin VapB